METLTYTAKRRGLLLDPRTKLLMLITVTSLMLSTGNSGVMNIVKPVLSVLPFILLLTEGRWKNLLFCPTGALHSPVATAQGESIPGICHAVALTAPGGT